MEKIILFASEQWLLITALAACVAGLAWLDKRRSGTSISPHQLTRLINHDDGAVLIDLRDKADFDAGHIVDAVNLPFGKWQSQQSGGDTELTKLLPNDKSKPIVLVCKMGQQSSHVAKKLASDGYGAVHRLSGGLTEWQSAQMPLVKD